MKRIAPITTLFLDIGGVLLTDGWDRHARKRAATNFKLEWAEMEERHHLTFEIFEEGKITLEEAVQQVKNESHRLVRMQYNWFSPKDDRIHWFDADADPYMPIKTLVTGFLKA